MLLLILSFHSSLFIGLVIGVWPIIFLFMLIFYNEIFEYYLVKHIMIKIFFYPNYFMKYHI